MSRWARLRPILVSALARHAVWTLLVCPAWVAVVCSVPASHHLAALILGLCAGVVFGVAAFVAMLPAAALQLVATTFATPVWSTPRRIVLVITLYSVNALTLLVPLGWFLCRFLAGWDTLANAVAQGPDHKGPILEVADTRYTSAVAFAIALCALPPLLIAVVRELAAVRRAGAA